MTNEANAAFMAEKNNAELKHTLDTCQELMLYYLINEFGRRQHAVKLARGGSRSLSAAHVSPEAEMENQHRLEYAVEQSRRFGVETPRDGNIATPEYWAWFQWWNDYAQDTDKLTPEQMDEINAIMSQEPVGDLSKFRPEGFWQLRLFKTEGGQWDIPKMEATMRDQSLSDKLPVGVLNDMMTICATAAAHAG